MDKKDELYSDKYKTSDFHWGVSLGEGKHLSRSARPPPSSALGSRVSPAPRPSLSPPYL